MLSSLYLNWFRIFSKQYFIVNSINNLGVFDKLELVIIADRTKNRNKQNSFILHGKKVIQKKISSIAAIQTSNSDEEIKKLLAGVWGIMSSSRITEMEESAGLYLSNDAGTKTNIALANNGRLYASRRFGIF